VLVILINEMSTKGLGAKCTRFHKMHPKRAFCTQMHPAAPTAKRKLFFVSKCEAKANLNQYLRVLVFLYSWFLMRIGGRWAKKDGKCLSAEKSDRIKNLPIQGRQMDEDLALRPFFPYLCFILAQCHPHGKDEQRRRPDDAFSDGDRSFGKNWAQRIGKCNALRQRGDADHTAE